MAKPDDRDFDAKLHPSPSAFAEATTYEEMEFVEMVWRMNEEQRAELFSHLEAMLLLQRVAEKRRIN